MQVLLRKIVAVIAAVCTGPLPAQSAPSSEPPSAAPYFKPWGFDLSGQDSTVRPGDDFNAFANGHAIQALVVPSDRFSYGSSTQLAELSEARVHVILEELASNTVKEAGASQKAGLLYRAFTDQVRINRLGVSPLTPYLHAVRFVHDRTSLAKLLGQVNDGFYESPIAISISSDERDPDRYAVHLSQAGLGLPSRDYYLRPDFATTRKSYEQYVSQMLQLIGWVHPADDAASIVAFETRIAQISMSPTDSRDPVKTYNPMTIHELGVSCPGFPWRLFLKTAGVGGASRVVVQQKIAACDIARLYAEVPLDVLKAWEAFHLADRAAPYLSAPFIDANFAFRGTVLTGQTELAPRWKLGTRLVNEDLGEAVGQVYVARYFPPASKAAVLKMVADLKLAFRQRIERLPWMGPETKMEALRKLDAYAVKVGYPDHWRDYTGLQIRPDDLLGDVARARAFEWNRQVQRSKLPVDRTEWQIPPQIVQAGNIPEWNQVLFTAAILQPPLFDPHADPAVNYGGIGAVIGHELTHGFDDQGRQYDHSGRLRDWWTAADAEHFRSLSSALSAQYSRYQPIPNGPYVNGNLTLGENLADLGGLNIALDAYHASLQGMSAPVLTGYSGDQRFFLAWAQWWRNKTLDARMLQYLVSDPHSPAKFRVNGTVRNINEWYTTFAVVPSDALYLTLNQRLEIW